MKRRNCIQVSIAPSPGPQHSIVYTGLLFLSNTFLEIHLKKVILRFFCYFLRICTQKNNLSAAQH